jgi:drug/metabolite transporter (DMT)-like permease
LGRGWEEEVLRRRFHIRRMVGLAAIAAGVLIIVVFVPSWVWYIVLAALLCALAYTLYCFYLR